jgi:hypothetical protein
VVIWIIVLGVLSAAGPILVAVLKAAVPLVISIGAGVLVLRGVWFFTNRW